MIQPVFAFSSSEGLREQARQNDLGHHPYWQRLLHDRRNLLGIYQSEIDDPAFFLSPLGRKDPVAELDATLEAFFKPVPQASDAQPAACRYPARYAWLKEQLETPESRFPVVSCPRFEKWKSQMDPESLTLVFASYYMNNPASTYGHSFLRLNARTHSSNERLLDYVVNFAADLESDNGFLFAVKGLLGGYHGRFSTMPYYMKVQEYSNFESRDLWEYNLKVSPGHLQRLVEHLWELGNTRIPYYFFNKNCSYYLLPVLEVMDPSLTAARPFVLKAIPMDTVRQVIRTPGLLESVVYRPSQATRMIRARNRLTDREIGLAERIVKRPGSDLSGEMALLLPERRALVLDSAYDLFRYRVGFSRDQPPAIQEQENALLLERNAVGVVSPVLQISSFSVVSPDQGHKTGRVDLAYGFSNHSHFEELSIRPSLHDQDDPVGGYLPGSKLELFHLKLRYDNDRKTAYIQEFPVVDLISITPWDRWIHPLSWKVKTGVMTANDLNRDPENSLYYGLNLGSGYSFWVPGTERRLLVYGMAELESELGAVFDHDVRFGGGPGGGLLYNPVTFWRARLQMSHTVYAIGGPSTTKLSLHQSLSLTKNSEIRAAVQRQNLYKEILLSWVLFL